MYLYEQDRLIKEVAMYNYKIKYKIFALFILICFTLHTVTTTFSKYVKDMNVGTVNLKITGKRYWEGIEGVGFADGAFKEIVNTERTLILESMGKSRSSRKNKNSYKRFISRGISIIF